MLELAFTVNIVLSAFVGTSASVKGIPVVVLIYLLVANSTTILSLVGVFISKLVDVAVAYQA